MKNVLLVGKHEIRLLIKMMVYWLVCGGSVAAVSKY
jgi:hypothetical protein